MQREKEAAGQRLISSAQPTFSLFSLFSLVVLLRHSLGQASRLDPKRLGRLPWIVGHMGGALAPDAPSGCLSGTPFEIAPELQVASLRRLLKGDKRLGPPSRADEFAHGEQRKARLHWSMGPSSAQQLCQLFHIYLHAEASAIRGNDVMMR
ncbi:hypothetical protein FA10DRAFT_201548 [Acaromyces ingoldii]|uniref:Uncharacterized protein n=1 Tax=Acaromyces ingoldii TaxID=215250 RepID=A0A316YCA5_9BASI|nr:hypothetical protein FA10DRAFT_201548 [Acaromyces ingoldii]PWN86869.1 hypothetical protein FA10DRAFT_201548 [Acaromyces ingoldii]